MGRGILRAQLDLCGKAGERTAGKSEWKRREGFNLTYEFADVIKSALGIFLFQHLSMLSYQGSLNRGKQRKNAENIPGVKEIPCGSQITRQLRCRRLLDVAEPEVFNENFETGIEQAERYGVLEQYKVLDGGVLTAVDGVWFQPSEKASCNHCLHMTKKGITACCHSMAAAVIVRPGGDVVLPLMPEMIRNESGAPDEAESSGKKSYEEQKQDCERKAVTRQLRCRRLLEKHGEYCNRLKATLPGDDLYASHNTCKDESHPWTAEQVKRGCAEELNAGEWNGKYHLEHRYRWVNGVENRAGGEKLAVNHIRFETYNREKSKAAYKNSWITDKPVTKENVKLLAECGRARWKTENGNSNVLKNGGYRLEHNFGHGKNHACEIYCILNLLAFLVHGLMILCDENFKSARSYFGRKAEFYNALRTFFWSFEFQSWDDFLLFVICHAKGG
ncbi:MAG: hypothetical protein LBK61_01200 [Spirochaetaceae bacterium]|jgi:hypothetical protein|nr:hypothetical protein [Spirochaetaceae bacterium]